MEDKKKRVQVSWQLIVKTHLTNKTQVSLTKIVCLKDNI